MNMPTEESMLNPYWVFYCKEHDIDPLIKLRTYCDFVGWINARHTEFCPGEAIRHTPEYIEGFIIFLENRRKQHRKGQHGNCN